MGLMKTLAMGCLALGFASQGASAQKGSASLAGRVVGLRRQRLNRSEALMARCSRLLAGGLLAGSVACARAPVTAWPGPARRFYAGRAYGSEAIFNPATEILNEGFDVLALRGQDRHIFDRDLGPDARNVLRSIVHADATYRNYGWSVLRNEFLPVSNQRQPGGGSWLPNYQSHLFGSGMISARMTEWYAMHGVRHPGLWSAGTMMTAHFLNEAVENNGWRALNEDATTDLLFFDLGGILVWRNQYVQRAFSGHLKLTNWTGQPSYNPAARTLENTGQLFVLRGPIPRSTDWRWFYLFGMSGAGGLSRAIGGGQAISVGLGLDAVENPITDSTRMTKGATLKPKAAVYWDREGSLLASVSVGSPRGMSSWLTVNLYPGVVRIGRISPGFWLQLPRDGGVRGGIVSSWGLGLGGGPSH